jgi:hypothetical protein
MRRDAAQYAVLSPLFDEALLLDDAARADWLARLPEVYANHRPALQRILRMDTRSPRLDLLALKLRSCGHGVAVLVLAEFDRRKNRTF